MKALTIRHPWASLVVAGLKAVENRSWSTTYRGRIYIHAANRKATEAELDDAREIAIRAGISTAEIDRALSSRRLNIMGAIIGHVELCDIVRSHDSPFTNHRYEYHWTLARARRITPIETRGQQGLWEYTGKIRRR